MDITIIPNFPVTLFSLHHKNITSLSTVKLYFQKKIIQNIFWIYANENQSAKYTPLTLKTNYKNCSLCRRTIYVSLLHIILLSLSLLLNCLSGACALTSSQKASHTHRPVLSHHTVRENTQSMTSMLAIWLHSCKHRVHTVIWQQIGVTLSMLQATMSFLLPCSKAVRSYVALVVWH